MVRSRSGQQGFGMAQQLPADPSGCGPYILSRLFARTLFASALFACNLFRHAQQSGQIASSDRRAGWLALLLWQGAPRALCIQRLVNELNDQILPDGGHVSRNPLAIVSILLELLPLRQTFMSRDMVPPEGMNLAIERMMPMLRFFRHPSGSFAHFNGTRRHTGRFSGHHSGLR